MSEITTMYGCGVLSAVFGRRSRRSVSTSSLDVPDIPVTPSSQTPDSRRRKGSDGAPPNTDRIIERPSPNQTPDSRRRKGSDGAPPNTDRIIDRPSPNQTPDSRRRKGSDGAPNTDRIIEKPSPNQKRKVTPPLHVPPQQQVVKRSAPGDIKNGPNGQQHLQSNNGNIKVSQGMMISGELEAMIDDQQRTNNPNNMKVYGNLGNLKQPNTNKVDQHPKTDREVRSMPNGMGNISRTQNKVSQKTSKPTSYCRALSVRMDPEQLKIMGNEDYKNGRFVEALSLYDAAISIDPEKASYRSNKTAALTSLGRLLEAVFEAREAIRIEPFYQRAHNRLATLYLRLGVADKTIHHYKQAGSEAEPDLITKAQKLQVHLKRCEEAKKQRNWNTLLKETSLAISAGADSALQIYTLKAEALLKLHRPHEADHVMHSAPKFEVDDCTKFYGPISHANLLVIRVQVDLTAGRIDDAVEAAQIAMRMDPKNKDVNMMVNRTKAVMGAKSKGNELFKATKFSEACIAYGEGLEHDPSNSVLLCNRAACRTKLGQFEKAIEDCTLALNIRPSYSKARLRRADCNAKLGKWQASIDDYEMLTSESPEDEEVSKAMREVKEKLMAQRGDQNESTMALTM